MTGNIGTVAWIAPEIFQSKKYLLFFFIIFLLLLVIVFVFVFIHLFVSDLFDEDHIHREVRCVFLWNTDVRAAHAYTAIQGGLIILSLLSPLSFA